MNTVLKERELPTGQILQIAQGDITAEDVDAIVNAANNDLILGGGLAGAIARKGGPEIQKECDAHGPVNVGGAAITTAGNLPARYVIHAASMALGRTTTAEALAECVRATLTLADQHGIKSIAFPAIGTGIARFPLNRCAQLMLTIIKEHLGGSGPLEDVHVVLFDDQSYQAFSQVYLELI